MSLALSFAYSLMLIVVPTSPSTEEVIAAAPDTELRVVSQDEQILTVSKEQTSDQTSDQVISATIH